MHVTLKLFLYILFGSILGLAGGFLFLFNKKSSGFLEKHSIPFAAGVLITVSLVGLVPEAFELIQDTSLLVLLISFFVAYLFEHFIFEIHHHGHDEHKDNHYSGSALLVIVGDTIHNFIDGIAITASFIVNPGLGFIAAFSTFLHEIPHEVGDFAILLKAGYSPTKTLLINVISALFSFGGMVLALYLSTDHRFDGIMLSISAGIFLYLGTVDFLPNISRGYKSKVASLIPLAIGVIIMIVTLSAIPHSH